MSEIVDLPPSNSLDKDIAVAPFFSRLHISIFISIDKTVLLLFPPDTAFSAIIVTIQVQS